MAQSHQKPFSRRQLAVIGKIAFIEAMALSLIIPTISSTGEIPSTNLNHLTGPIIFNSARSATSTISIPAITLTTGTWLSSPNETVLVVTSTFGLNPSKVITVKDSLGNTYIKRLNMSIPANPTYDLELWTTKSLTSGTNSVTATWNVSDAFVLQAISYDNAISIGNLTFTKNGPSQTITSVITTTKSGSWIIGIIGERSSDSCPPTSEINTSPLFIRRISTCEEAAGPETEISDNATSLRNAFTINFSPTINLPPELLVAITLELVSSDLEPQQQNINLFTLCSTIGDTCHINSVKLSTGANALNQVLALNTQYCTGITTSALTLSSSSTYLLAMATYGAVSLNQTGAKLLIQEYVTSTSPSTVFGLGNCSASNTSVVGTASIYFAISGAVSQTTTFTTTISGVCGTAPFCITPATVYGYLTITPQNFVGHINYDQVTNQAYSTASINLIQIK